MKSALILLTAGLCGANYIFKNPEGQELIFDYSGRMLTGIPQLDSTFAGMSLKSKVYVQEISQDYFKFQMRDVRYGTFNEKLSGPRPENWRSVELESSTELTGEYKEYLETPFEVKMKDGEDGEVEFLKISTTEPQWSVNMKKALISTLKIQVPTSSKTWSSSESRKESPRFSYVKKQQEREGESPLFWSVMEEGIEGKCENTYQVSELPEYMIHDYEKGMINPALCEGKKYFQILRTRDITRCTEKNIFLSSKGHKNCLVGNCESENTKQTQTRFYACADSVTEIPYWHGIINEGEMKQHVLAFNTEPVVTGTKQVIKLEKIQKISYSMPEITAPRMCHDLTYEFPVSKSERSEITSRQSQREIFERMTKDPRTMSFIPAIYESLNTEKLRSEIVEKLLVIAKELQTSERFAEKEIPSQLKALKTVISVLKTEDIKHMFETILSLSCTAEEKQIVRNLFFDLVRSSGSPATVMFLLECIREEKLTETEMYLSIVTLSHYMRTPTEELIHEVFKTIKSEAVRSRFWLKGSSHLVFANIVRNACLGSAKSYYPEDVFGKMCTSSNKRIVQEYIPHLVQELKSATTSIDKQISLWSLGQLAHESVVPIMINYMEGRTQDSTNQLRKVSLYALSDVAHFYKHKLIPVFLAVATNPAEARNLRIAAISMLMKCQPETVYLQKLAVMTWFEQDLEVSRFIYSMLKEQSMIELESQPEESYLRELSLKAKTVFPLCKPMHVIVGVNKIYSNNLRELEVGSYMLNSIMPGSDSTEFYHKTEFFLKQAQTTPIEFAFHYSGLKSLARSLLSSVSKSSESIHPKLKEIVEKLDISYRKDDEFSVGAWMRLEDSINFAVELNQDNIELMKNKVLLAIKNSGMEIMDKVCGRTPINHQNVYESLPYQAVVPSDLGLPIVVETQMTHLYSVQGYLDVECSYNKPSVAMELSYKTGYTYNGFAGTICPFTQELLAAGINIHRATNLPMNTMVEFEPKTSLMKVKMSQSESVLSSHDNIDVHVYQVKPYTVKKPLVFEDLTPTVLHPNTKIIESRATRKSYEADFGEFFDVSMTGKVETECDLYDVKMLLDSWRNYNYNPFTYSAFQFTESALTSEGRPSARYHKYSLVYSPSKSRVNGAEMTVQFSLAKKMENEEAKKVSLKMSRESSIEESHLRPESSKSELRMDDCLRKLDTKVGYALNAFINAKLTGGEEKTYTYSVTAAAGRNEMTHKWNVHWENEQEQSYMKNLCINGHMQYPTSYSSDTKFEYANKVAFGQTCDEYYFNIEGNTFVSHKQQEYSFNSEEAKKCLKHTQEEERYRHELNNCREHEIEKKTRLEKKHSISALKKFESCERKMDQSSALDQTDITITYSRTLPAEVYSHTKTLNTLVKVALFPYVYQVSEPSQTSQTLINLKFDQKTNTVSMELESPIDTVYFKNVRLPAEMREIIPLVARKSPVEQTYKALTGTSLLAKCVLGQGYVQTYDKKAYSYQIDECDHLITSDCSRELTHAILAKEVNGHKHVTIFEGKTKIEVSPAQSYQNYVEDWTLEVDGKKVSLNKNEEKTLENECTVYWHSDNVVEINTPHARITHKGRTVSVEEKSLMADGSHCGLCGDYNMDQRADIKSPKECVLSSDKLSAYSYRVKSDQCKPLSKTISEEIKSEEEKCVKYTTQNTEVSTIWKSSKTDVYTERKHSYIYKEDKICISQDPIVYCSSGSVAKDIRRKSVKYVCLPEGRVAKLYEARIQRGESPQELKHQPVAFTAEMEQPVSCVARKY